MNFYILFLLTTALLPATTAQESAIPTPWDTPLPRPGTSNPHNWHDGYCYSTRLNSNDCNALYICEAAKGTSVANPHCQFQILDSNCRVIGLRQSPKVGDAITGEGLPHVATIKGVKESVDQRRIDKGIKMDFEYSGTMYGTSEERAVIEDCRFGDPKVGWTRLPVLQSTVSIMSETVSVATSTSLAPSLSRFEEVGKSVIGAADEGFKPGRGWHF
ncbi:hypothetical protein BDV96DRAFT_597021 [Lophiotrema nucula]|uniref:Uncharacterized protein n=1 Tax=Lophiotrema nucula TaxID=690887 RepID=A0A6A5ZH93_9PLEO|nr:hypothetical protein BDV96DRAFT_597021 [Lophiotrema nucula]